jgi:hypothetical protein
LILFNRLDVKSVRFDVELKFNVGRTGADVGCCIVIGAVGRTSDGIVCDDDRPVSDCVDVDMLVGSNNVLVRSLKNAEDEFDEFDADMGVIAMSGTLELFVVDIDETVLRSGMRST